MSDDDFIFVFKKVSKIDGRVEELWLRPEKVENNNIDLEYIMRETRLHMLRNRMN